MRTQLVGSVLSLLIRKSTHYISCFRHSTFVNTYNSISCAAFYALKMEVSLEMFSNIYTMMRVAVLISFLMIVKYCI